LQIIEETKNTQLMLIADGFRQGLISQKRYTDNSLAILQKFTKDNEEEVKKLREPFTQMTKNIKDAGKNNIDVIRSERNERLKILQDAAMNSLLKEGEFGESKLLILKKYQDEYRKIREEEKRPILDLAKELKYAGQLEIQELQSKTNDRLLILSAGFKKALISQQEFNALSTLVQKDYNTKFEEIEKKKIQPFLDVQKTIRDAAFSETEQIRQDMEARRLIIEDAARNRLITQQQLTDSLLANEKYYNNELANLTINQASTWAQLGDAIANEFENIGFTMNDIAKEIKQGLVNGIGASFQWLGRSLATHSADWKDLQKNIGNILAGMASMFGNFFITLGMAMLASGPITGLSISGGQAIAAGLALQVLAGALGTMGGDSSGHAMAGSPAAEAGLNQDLTNVNRPEDQKRPEPQQILNVTINGDVLDSDETGMRIVRLINDAYDKKGVQVRQGAYA